MSMPSVVREYIQSFRQRERIKTLQLAAQLRRGGLTRDDGLALQLADQIQRWRDEDREHPSPRSLQPQVDEPLSEGS